MFGFILIWEAENSFTYPNTQKTRKDTKEAEEACAHAHKRT